MATNDTPESVSLLFLGVDERLLELYELTAAAYSEAFDVRTATDADDALSLVDSGVVDCLVTCHELRGTTGLDVVRTLRADDCGLPIVLYAWEAPMLRTEAADAGVDAVVERRTGDHPHAELFSQVEDLVATNRSLPQ